jgi:hypothetical protein
MSEGIESLTQNELDYLKGMKDAWGTALYLSLSKKEDLEKVFNTNIKTSDIMVDVLSHYTPTEVKNMLDEYYQNNDK